MWVASKTLAVAPSLQIPDGILDLITERIATVLELEDVLTTSWQNAAAIEAYVERFRGDPEIISVLVPEDFKGR